MRKETIDQIEKNRNQSKGYSELSIMAVEVIGKFVKLIEEHKHYKVITSRVTKKFENGTWSAHLSTVYGSPKVKLNGYVNGRYQSFSIYLGGKSFTPSNILDESRVTIESYKMGIKIKDYKEEEKILRKIDKLIGDNRFVTDLIDYGLYNH